MNALTTLLSAPRVELRLNSLTTEMTDNPLELLNNCNAACRNLDRGVRYCKWLLISVSYGCALNLSVQADGLQTLSRHPIVGRKYDCKAEDVLRLSLIVGTNAVGQLRYKSACAQAKILQPFFDRNIDPETLLDLLTASGGLRALDIEKLITPKPKVRLLMPGEREVGPVMGDDEGGMVHLRMPSPSTDDVKQPSPEAVRRRASPVRYPARPTQKPFFCEKKLHCRVGLMQQADANRLKNMQVGECANLVVECQEAPGGRKYIQVTDILDA